MIVPLPQLVRSVIPEGPDQGIPEFARVRNEMRFVLSGWKLTTGPRRQPPVRLPSPLIAHVGPVPPQHV